MAFPNVVCGAGKMLDEDRRLAELIGAFWSQGDILGDACPLLADMQRLLSFLDAQGFKPGDALWPCPECGENHRWTLIRELIIQSLYETEERTKLQEIVDRSLDSVRELYGGRDGYEAYRLAASKYFDKVKVKHCYKL